MQDKEDDERYAYSVDDEMHIIAAPNRPQGKEDIKPSLPRAEGASEAPDLES